MRSLTFYLTCVTFSCSERHEPLLKGNLVFLDTAYSDYTHLCCYHIFSSCLLLLLNGSANKDSGGGHCPRDDCNSFVVYSADTTDHIQQEEEEDRRFTWSDDVSLGHLYIARHSKQ